MPAMVSGGAVYALLDASDGNHAGAAAAVRELEGPLVLVAPVLTDAMRLAARYLGQALALRLLEATLEGELLLQPLERRDLQEARRLMSLGGALSASAALTLAAAERLGVRDVLVVEPATRRAVERLGLRLWPAEDGCT